MVYLLSLPLSLVPTLLKLVACKFLSCLFFVVGEFLVTIGGIMAQWLSMVFSSFLGLF